jgi:hypothetical protein
MRHFKKHVVGSTQQMKKLPILTVVIPEKWEVHTTKNPIFGPNVFYSRLRPKNT